MSAADSTAQVTKSKTNPSLFFVFTSADCNLSCTYCGATAEDLQMPHRPTYPVDDLAKFFESEDGEGITVVFYGGEPLTSIPFLRKVMDRYPKAQFILQSNVTLLHSLPTEYLLRLWSILVSIDGSEATTDGYRSKGLYKRVMDNVHDAIDRGYKGPLVARMTCSMKTDIAAEAIHLLRDAPVPFTAVYWQMDVGFDAPMNTRWGDFPGWMNNQYKPSLDRLRDFFVAELKEGRAPIIVPFLGVLNTVLGRSAINGLRCGVGVDTWSITTDGRLMICPVGFDEPWNCIGDIHTSTKSDLERVDVAGACDKCSIRNVCGGRCLYVNKTAWWGDEGMDWICEGVRHLVKIMEDLVPDVKKMLEEGHPALEMALDDPALSDFSLEIIP
ncbi:4Fe-4S single cluster domain [Carpediemonas membranifera]|uniref:4Fe-4S single cluster domain n=1 Tax=Carpediemonas membranifera TaxID=201153 RepID=A0A8J6BTX7_9EUKA|nr:4Fe-4S single cluster domain [Carpediemonas membranifera]|eukprot:KAG9389781.1 4Fe-4S single cluster domain [Carpediemonas membranifera]